MGLVTCAPLEFYSGLWSYAVNLINSNLLCCRVNGSEIEPTEFDFDVHVQPDWIATAPDQVGTGFIEPQ